MTKTITVKRLANTSRQDALQGLLTKFPEHNIASFGEEHEVVNGEQKTFYVAMLTVAGEFPPSDEEGKEEEQAETEATPKEDNEPKDEPKEKSEGDKGGDKPKGNNGKLDEIIRLIHELLGDDSAPSVLGDEPGPGPAGPPPADKPLPAPVQPQNKMENMQQPMGLPTFARKRSHIASRSDGAEITLKQAVAELYQEFGPYGYRVAKIERRGTNIVAALVKRNG